MSASAAPVRRSGPAPAASGSSWTPLDLARRELLALSSWERPEPAGRLALDANEVPWRPAGDSTTAGLNRYPPTRARTLERRLAEILGVTPDQVLATRGSDEAIDLLVRAFCRPGRDAVAVLRPTFAMYARAARIQGARIVEVARSRAGDWALPLERLAAEVRPAGVKLLFVPDPDNPTGRRVSARELERLAELTAGRALLVVDEAYAEFTLDDATATSRLRDCPHLVVLRTLSKAHALAGARLGALVAAPQLVGLLARLLPPFALPQPSLDAAAKQLAPAALVETARRVRALCAERDRLAGELAALGGVTRLFPSAANFLLVAFRDRERAERALADAGVEVRLFDDPGLADCLRLTVGSRRENRRLLTALRRAEA